MTSMPLIFVRTTLGAMAADAAVTKSSERARNESFFMGEFRLKLFPGRAGRGNEVAGRALVDVEIFLRDALHVGRRHLLRGVIERVIECPIAGGDALVEIARD